MSPSPLGEGSREEACPSQKNLRLFDVKMVNFGGFQRQFLVMQYSQTRTRKVPRMVGNAPFVVFMYVTMRTVELVDH